MTAMKTLRPPLIHLQKYVVIPKARVFTSGPRALRWHDIEEREILRSA